MTMDDTKFEVAISPSLSDPSPLTNLLQTVIMQWGYWDMRYEGRE